MTRDSTYIKPYTPWPCNPLCHHASLPSTEIQHDSCKVLMVALSTRARNILHLYSLNKIILSSTYAKMDSYDSIGGCARLVSIETLYPTRSSGIETLNYDEVYTCSDPHVEFVHYRSGQLL